MTALEPDLLPTSLSSRASALDSTATEPLSLPPSLAATFDQSITDPILTPPSSPSSAPVVQNLPRARKRFVNKYTENAAALERVPTPIRNALIAMDSERVAKGQYPLSNKQTALALMAAMREQAVTPEPSKSPLDLFGNALDDLQTITKAIPRLPMAMVKEVQSLPKLPAEFNRLQEEGLNPVAALAQSPGIRLIPGAYVVGNIAAGTPGQLAEHPLFTALDVIPAAKRAAAATKVGKAATATGMNPMRAVLTRRIEPVSGELVPGKLGRITDPLITKTRPGEILRETFGKTERRASAMQAHADAQARALYQADETLPDPAIQKAQVAARFQRDGLKQYGITPQRNLELKAIAEIGDPRVISTLPLNEQSFLRDFTDATRQVDEAFQSMDLLRQHGAETFDLETWSRLNKAQTRYDRSIAKLKSDSLDKLNNHVVTNPAVQPIIDAINEAMAGTRPWADVSQMIGAATPGRTLVSNVSTSPRWSTLSNSTMASVPKLKQQVRNIVNAEKLRDLTTARNVPARFIPLIQSKALERLENIYIARAPNAAVRDQIIQAFADRNYSAIPGWDDKLRLETINDVARTWQDLKAQGYDPIFVHRAPTNAEVSLQYPKIGETVTKPSSVKPRDLYDVSPHHQDMTVALGHQAMEVIRRKVAETFTDDLVSTFGETGAALRDRYLPAARVKAQVDPTKDIEGHVQELMDREWVAYDSKSILRPKTKAASSQSAADQIFLPKTVKNNLMRQAPGPGSLSTAFMEPIMAAFRTSLLPLSPRWHIYNIIGGAAMLTARTGPGVFKYLGQARNILKDIQAGGTGAVAGTNVAAHGLPEFLRRSLGSIGRDVMEFNYYAGKTQSRILEGIAQNHPRGHAYIRNVTDAAGKVIKKSFDMNAFFDDTYRVMAYLYGQDKALTKGLTREAAAHAGIELSRKIMQSWDAMTPIERQIIRHVFPFYGFMSHITRYVMQYPFDHPVRASVMASFARNELEDLGTGLPQSMLNSFTYGDMDENGNISAINFGGMNPFHDVANLFTLSGLVGDTNPVLASVMQQLGVDTSTGGAELYPNLIYDPETGRLKADTGNPFLNLFQNTVPQTRVLGAMAGFSSEFKALSEHDPEAARRLLRSQLGLPVFMRDINLPQEYFKTEIARSDAEKKAISAAFKGDTSQAKKYPHLLPLIATLDELKRSGALTEFQPNQSEASMPEVLRKAVLSPV